MSLGPGPQFHPPTLVSCTLADQYAWWEQAAAGPNMTVLGAPTYPTDGVFAGATRFNANNEAWIQSGTGALLFGNAGCMEMWMRPQGWALVNGGATATPTGVTNTFVYCRLWPQDWHVVFYPAEIEWAIYRNAVINAPNFLGAIAGFDIADGAWGHIAFVWDTTGIGGGPNTRRRYGVSVI